MRLNLPGGDSDCDKNRYRKFQSFLQRRLKPAIHYRIGPIFPPDYCILKEGTCCCQKNRLVVAANWTQLLFWLTTFHPVPSSFEGCRVGGRLFRTLFICLHSLLSLPDALVIDKMPCNKTIISARSKNKPFPDHCSSFSQ